MKSTAILAILFVSFSVIGLWAQSPPEPAADLEATVLASRPLPDHLQFEAPKSLDELRLLEQHVKRVLEKVRPATVALSTGGSGVVVTEDGYILTCAHVNQKPGRVFTVTFPDGRHVRAVTLGNNHGVDAGLAKISEEGSYPFVSMGSSADVEPGQWCLAVGYPVSFVPGKDPAVRMGRVQVNKPRMIVTDCTIMGGDSGGPLFDLDGKVIGISSRVNNSIETNIHVPIDSYKENWERLVAQYDWSDEDRRSYLGITRDDSTEGVVIKDVKSQSPAEKAGVQVGDRLVEFDGRSIDNFDELLARMNERQPKDKVKLTVERGSKKLMLMAQLDFWPTDQN